MNYVKSLYEDLSERLSLFDDSVEDIFPREHTSHIELDVENPELIGGHLQRYSQSKDFKRTDEMIDPSYEYLNNEGNLYIDPQNLDSPVLWYQVEEAKVEVMYDARDVSRGDLHESFQNRSETLEEQSEAIRSQAETLGEVADDILNE